MSAVSWNTCNGGTAATAPYARLLQYGTAFTWPYTSLDPSSAFAECETFFSGYSTFLVMYLCSIRPERNSGSVSFRTIFVLVKLEKLYFSPCLTVCVLTYTTEMFSTTIQRYVVFRYIRRFVRYIIRNPRKLVV